MCSAPLRPKSCGWMGHKPVVYLERGPARGLFFAEKTMRVFQILQVSAAVLQGYDAVLQGFASFIQAVAAAIPGPDSTGTGVSHSP